MENLAALQTLVNAARLARLSGEEHDLIRKCAEQIANALKIEVKKEDNVIPIKE
jgi:hypothetical protein